MAMITCLSKSLKIKVHRTTQIYKFDHNSYEQLNHTFNNIIFKLQVRRKQKKEKQKETLYVSGFDVTTYMSMYLR